MSPALLPRETAKAVWYFLLSAGLFYSGCASSGSESSLRSQPPKQEPSANKREPVKSPAALTEKDRVSSSDVEAIDSPAAPASPVAAEELVSHFPPADPGPLFARSAREGDGIWRPFFEVGAEPDEKGRLERPLPADFDQSLVRRMVLHPHKVSPFQTMDLAVFDLTQLLLHHRPGLQDVRDLGKKHLEGRAGLVPEEERASLFAIFNGGFLPRHGRWGMLSLGEQLIAPRDDACTVAILRDGSLRIAPWPELADVRDEIVAYRQTPPCLIEKGEIHPRLKRRDRAPWAGQIKSRKTRRRSGVGLSADGKTLFFGVGEETEPETLAAGLLHAGAQQAAQLDINWNWTRLFLYEGKGGESKSLGALSPNMAKDHGEYLKRPAKRGFFYLTRR